jgi:hypothetical protein
MSATSLFKFVNNLFVDSNGKGLYKRKSKTRTITSYLVGDILRESISLNNFDDYLNTIEIVNGPNLSTHNMVVDNNGNIWVVEPGRGNMKNTVNDSQYFIMTNFSVIDFNAGKKYADNGFDRYKIVKNNLEKTKKLTIENSFNILEKTKQDGEWKTDFSMVYTKKENKVFYCYNGNYKEILEYKF